MFGRLSFITILFIILLIILLNYTFKNKENFMNNEENWYNYRLGDMLEYCNWPEWRKKKKHNYDFLDPVSVSKRYPNSIGDIYFKRLKKKEKNLDLLYKIIDEKSHNNKNIPKNNEVVLHLRIGDVIEKCDNDVFKYRYSNHKHSKGFYAIKLENIKNNLNLFKNKKVILVYGNHLTDTITNTQRKCTELYLQKIRELFKNNNITFQERQSGNPDEDFVYMCNSKVFCKSGGGYSNLISKYVRSRGNEVIDLNNKVN
jgi:hypothetical protein